MRTLLHRALAIVCVCILCTVVSTPCRAESKQPVEWTIMAYICADNDLEFPALMDFLEMEQALPENVELIVLLDRHRGYASIYGDWTGARLYRVRRAAPFDIQPAADNKPNAPLPPGLASEQIGRAHV